MHKQLMNVVAFTKFIQLQPGVLTLMRLANAAKVVVRHNA